MEDIVTLLPEERLEMLSDSIISSIINKDELSLQNRQVAFGQLPTKSLRDENYLIYLVLYNFKDKRITPDSIFLETYLTRNIKLIKKSQRYINLSEYKDLDDNSYIAYVSAVMKKYNRLVQENPLSLEDFKLTLEKYKSEFCAIEMNKAFSQAKIILYDGMQLGSRYYQGYEDSIAYVKNVNADVESLLDQTSGEGFIDSRTTGIEDSEKTKLTKIGDFDLITELNEKLGGIYSGIFYNVLAPTKNGKSKFCARITHTAMVKYGTNVSVWAHEGGYEAWWAQMRAIHFEYLYIRNKPDGEKVAPLSQKDILHGNYPSPEIKQLEEASRLDLFTNPNYGVLNMIDRPFKVETFIDDIETSVQLNNSKLVVIDYLQLIGWDSKNMNKNQAISTAYQNTLTYCKKRNIGVISPSQFKQESVNELANAKDGSSHELRTAGGESSEIIRTPDVNIVLYSSIEDLLRKKMTIKSIPSRFAEPFPDIDIYADLCSCVFSSMDGGM